MKLFKLFTEEIEAETAYTEDGSLNTVLNGDRNVGFIQVKKPMIEDIEKTGLKLIPIRLDDIDTLQCIVYRQEGKPEALELYKILKEKDGYLSDETPEEAKKIGELLSYSENSINDYIWRRYHSKNEPSDNPDDYSDFH